MAKQQSLAAQTGTLDAGLRLPSVFQAPMEPIKARFIAPYITFAHSKRADEWSKLVHQFGQVAEGEMYLIRERGAVHLSPARLAMVKGHQYWAEASPAGEVLRVSFEEKPRPYKEHIECVCLCYLEDEVLPVNIQFRSTKCPAAKALADALAEAASPSWSEKSSAHKDSLVCHQPFMRYYGVVGIGPQRTSRSSGLNYRTTTCSIKPTGLQEWKLLKQFCEDPGAQKAMEDAAERFSYRLGELQSKAK